jgi:hypothetical protein
MTNPVLRVKMRSKRARRAATTPVNSMSASMVCGWVHAERLIHKLDTFTARHSSIVQPEL